MNMMKAATWASIVTAMLVGCSSEDSAPEIIFPAQTPAGVTPTPGVAPNPAVTPNPSVTPNPGVTPNPSVTPNPGVTPNPSVTPAPGNMTPTPTPGDMTPTPTPGDMTPTPTPGDTTPTPPVGGGASEFGDSSCLDGVTDFGPQGQFTFSRADSGRVNIWVPDVPAGCEVPVVHLANGTGASCATYNSIMDGLASHGFLVACYESAQTGAGTQGVEAIDTVFMNHGDIAANKIGSMGHSQGGQAAFTVLAQAEDKWGTTEYIYAGLAMQPASGFGSQPAGGWQPMYATIESPMFMFSGSSDGLVSAGWVSRGFAALDDSIEAYNWRAAGSTHIPTPNEETLEVAVPWFRWKLLGDNAACTAFKGLLSGTRWTSQEEQNAQDCQ